MSSHSGCLRAACVVPRRRSKPSCRCVRVDAEELERAAVLAGGIGDALLVLQDQQLGRVVAGEHAPQLRRVAAALDPVGGGRLQPRVGRRG